MMKDPCQNLEALYDDFVDETLDAATAARVEAHLEECPACRAQVGEMRQLLDAVAALPRRLEPPEDLWPEIAGRLEPREAPLPVHPSPLRSIGWQVAAALFFMTLGAFLGRSLPIEPTAGTLDGEVVAESSEEMALVSESSGSGVALAEAEYLRAKETLWLLALRREEDLSPVTRKVVERNLRILDRAIGELRSALEEDPGNQELEHRLLAHHRRGVDLLTRLARDEA